MVVPLSTVLLFKARDDCCILGVGERLARGESEPESVAEKLSLDVSELDGAIDADDDLDFDIDFEEDGVSVDVRDGERDLDEVLDGDAVPDGPAVIEHVRVGVIELDRDFDGLRVSVAVTDGFAVDERVREGEVEMVGVLLGDRLREYDRDDDSVIDDDCDAGGDFELVREEEGNGDDDGVTASPLSRGPIPLGALEIVTESLMV